MKTILFVFAIVFCFSFATSGQIVQTNKKAKSSETACKYGDENFVGENISMYVVNSDIREFLGYISEEFGCEFVLSNSLKKIPITSHVEQAPWNFVLAAMLDSQDLAVLVQKGKRSDSEYTKLFVSNKGEIFQDGKCLAPYEDSEVANAPLFSESIMLNANPPMNPNKFEILIKMVEKRLSSRGILKVDKESQEITITDVRGNLDALFQLIQIIEHEFTLQEQNRAEIENKEEKP